MLTRLSGILLHISSLPSEFGIGDLGPKACQFIDFLTETKQTYWQILPLNPVDGIFGNSPYSSLSAFAGNTLFISPELLYRKGWLSQKDVEQKPLFPKGKVDYEQVRRYKENLLARAFKQFKKDPRSQEEYFEFCQEQSYWLNDFALFVVLKEKFTDKMWSRWSENIKERESQAVNEFQDKLCGDIEYVKFLQYIFFKQWGGLRNYAKERGIQIVGDMPIYVTPDSADVWTHPHLFKLKENGDPEFAAGVPPDYFSETGQRWGNPVYNWEKLKETGYAWWIERLRHNLKLFDLVRIDHFRGFVAFWQIPAQEKTAIHGEWIPGAADDFFGTLRRQFPHLPIVAEDLGLITPDVTEAMRRYGFPGMKILLFAFDGDLKTHPYIPENYEENCFVYTGTHDNNTANGWFKKDASIETKKRLAHYFGREITAEDIAWTLIECAMASRAKAAIFPMQDILSLNEEARMNKPGTVHGNWQWRLESSSLQNFFVSKLGDLTQKYHRFS